MAHETPLVLAYSSELKDHIYRMNPGEPIHLLDQQALRGPIASIAIRAVVEDEDPFHRLNIASLIELDDFEADSGLITREVRDALAEDKPELMLTQPFDVMGHSILSVTHQDFHESATTILTPALLGRQWIVNSMLKDFRYDQLGDIEGVAHILDQHITTLRTLIAMLGAHYGEDDFTPSNFSISVPNMPTEEGEEVGKHHDSFDSFVGIDHIIAELREMIDIANMPDAELKEHGVERVQSVLMHGPSGVGKTALAYALADSLGAELTEIDLGQIQDIYVGTWAKNISDAFEEAYGSDHRILLFFDEADGLFTTGNTNSTLNITAVLKSQLERIKQYPHVFFVAATNNLDAIDVNIRAPKRIPLTLPVGKPLPKQRADIFRQLLIGERPQILAYDDLSGLETLEKIQQGIDFDKLSDLTDDLSAGEIKGLIARVNRQNYLAAKRSDSKAPQYPTQEQLIKAIEWANQHRS